MMTDFTCAEFRRRRDTFQVEAHRALLPQLIADFERIKAECAILQKRYKNANKHDQEIIMNDLKPLLFKKQDSWARMNATADGASVPEWGM